jgi:hypothetical protein
MRSRRVLALAVSLLVVMIVGVGVALARGKPSPSWSASSTTSWASATPSAERNAFVNDVARRLAVSRDELEAVVEAGALEDVSFAEDNGFISETQANFLRQAIRSGPSGGFERVWVGGKLGFGVGLGGFPLLGPSAFEGGAFLGRFDPMTAAADYLRMSQGGLKRALWSKTLAQVAEDRGKSVTGLGQALRAAAKDGWDRWVSQGLITTDQENALLGRFDSRIDDLVHGIPPAITDLADRLGIDRSKVIAAIKGAATDRVEAARARGLLTRSEANTIERRIRTAPGLPIGGIGMFCPGPGRMPMEGMRHGFGPPPPFFGGHRFERGPSDRGAFSY